MAYIGQSLTEGTRRVYTYVATASQTIFNAVYGVGAVDVYQNGILLQPTDYTATDGVTVVLGVGAAVNDEITVVCHNTFSVADTVSASQGGTFSSDVDINGDLTVDSSTLYVDSTNNRAGVGTTSPEQKLHVKGSNYNDQLVIERTDTSSKWGIAGNTSGAFQIYDINSANATRMVIDSSGHLGIGTTSPLSPLHVKASGAGWDDQVILEGATGNGWNIINDYGQNDDLRIRYRPTGTEVMRIGSAGQVTLPYQPAFNAYRNLNAFTMGTYSVIPMSATRLNRGGHFNTSSDRFTAPVSGVYFFIFNSIVRGPFTSMQTYFTLNGSLFAGSSKHFTGTTSGAWYGVQISSNIQMNAGDFVQVANGGTSVEYHGYDWMNFSGYLLG